MSIKISKNGDPKIRNMEKGNSNILTMRQDTLVSERAKRQHLCSKCYEIRPGMQWRACSNAPDFCNTLPKGRRAVRYQLRGIDLWWPPFLNASPKFYFCTGTFHIAKHYTPKAREAGCKISQLRSCCWTQQLLGHHMLNVTKRKTALLMLRTHPRRHLLYFYRFLGSNIEGCHYTKQLRVLGEDSSNNFRKNMWRQAVHFKTFFIPCLY